MIGGLGTVLPMVFRMQFQKVLLVYLVKIGLRIPLFTDNLTLSRALVNTTLLSIVMDASCEDVESPASFQCSCSYVLVPPRHRWMCSFADTLMRSELGST